MGARHADRLGTECPRDLAVPVAMAIALHRPGLPAIAQPAQKAVQFFAENGLIVLRIFARNRPSIGSKPSSHASSESALVSVVWFMA